MSEKISGGLIKNFCLPEKFGHRDLHANRHNRQMPANAQPIRLNLFQGSRCQQLLLSLQNSSFEFDMELTSYKNRTRTEIRPATIKIWPYDIACLRTKPVNDFLTATSQAGSTRFCCWLLKDRRLLKQRSKDCKNPEDILHLLSNKRQKQIRFQLVERSWPKFRQSEDPVFYVTTVTKFYFIWNAKFLRKISSKSNT